jgi:hypothetical protein
VRSRTATGGRSTSSDPNGGARTAEVSGQPTEDPDDDGRLSGPGTRVHGPLTPEAGRAAVLRWVEAALPRLAEASALARLCG